MGFIFYIDEVLYHARVHPEQKCHTLSTKQVADLHEKTLYVCQTAVAVNADSAKFPDNWLFNHRWVSIQRPNSNDIKRVYLDWNRAKGRKRKENLYLS